MYNFLNGKYLLDIIYNQYFVYAGLQTGYTLGKVLDRGTFEILGPTGASCAFNMGAKLLSKLDTGIITTYALYIVLSIITLIFILFTPVLVTLTHPDAQIFHFPNETRILIIYVFTFFLTAFPWESFKE